MRTAVAALVLVSGLGFATEAGADIFDTIAMCRDLYTKRNDFYHRKGLCFTRPGAVERYPNNRATCRHETSDTLPMSAAETRWVHSLVARERALGCDVIRP